MRMSDDFIVAAPVPDKQVAVRSLDPARPIFWVDKIFQTLIGDGFALHETPHQLGNQLGIQVEGIAVVAAMIPFETNLVE
jgi:hypothetical protein